MSNTPVATRNSSAGCQGSPRIGVLHLTRSLAPGGRREAILELLRRLPSHGIDIYLGCLDELGHEPGSIPRLPTDIEFFARKPLLHWQSLRHMARFCTERGISIIHTHDAASHFTSALLAVGRPKLRLLMTFHRTLGFESATLRARFRNAIAIARSEVVITGSRERRDHFIRTNWVRPSKVVRIPFGIDTDRFRPDSFARLAVRQEFDLPASCTLFVAAGHFGKEKGIDVVVRAFALFAEKQAPQAAGSAALLVLGDGAGEQRRAIHSLSVGVQGRIIFAGFRRDVERCFAAADALVHSPQEEAFGLVVAEAMASGLPILACDVGGIPDMVRPQVNGILVPRDAPEALADGMARLYLDEALRAKMGGESRRIAEDEFDANTYADRHAALYRSLMGTSIFGIKNDSAGVPLAADKVGGASQQCVALN